ACASIAGNYNLFTLPVTWNGTKITYDTSRTKTQRTSDTAANGFAAFSPDGTKIVWATNHYDPGASPIDRDIVTIPASGGTYSRLTTSANDEYEPDWQPQ